jgi:hypothetical protein
MKGAGILANKFKTGNRNYHRRKRRAALERVERLTDSFLCAVARN